MIWTVALRRRLELVNWWIGGLANWQISTELNFRAEIDPRESVRSVLSVFPSAVVENADFLE